MAKTSSQGMCRKAAEEGREGKTEIPESSSGRQENYRLGSKNGASQPGQKGVPSHRAGLLDKLVTADIFNDKEPCLGMIK